MGSDSSRAQAAGAGRDTGNDVRVFALSAALPLAAGLLLLDGYGLLGWGGVVLAAIAEALFGVWWVKRYRALVPQRPATQPVVWVCVLAAVLAVVALALG